MQQLVNLLTGVMTDQKVTLGNNLGFTAGGTPTTSNLGTNVASVTLSGNNMRGRLTITAGASNVLAGTRICTVTFSSTNPHGSTVYVFVQNSTGNSSSSFNTGAVTGSSFDLYLESSSIPASSTLTVDYWVIE